MTPYDRQFPYLSPIPRCRQPRDSRRGAKACMAGAVLALGLIIAVWGWML